MLSRDDIKQAMAEGHLKIFPFEAKNLTGIGYNLSTTDFAFSIKQGMLLTIHKRTKDSGVERYVTIPGNDTVLFFSKEYIEIDHTLAGTFHSKVSRVSEGLGHISTTLDAAWKGQLLISVNNPTSNEIKFDLDKSGGNIMTMLLHKLDTPVTGDNVHDNNQGRCELLIAHFADPMPDKAYKEKQLELRDYVEKELANSLNGYDDFLDPDQPRDRYSTKIEQLIRLRERFKQDLTIMQEDRYELGKEGKYFYLKSREEKALINDCALFQITTDLQSVLEGKESQGVDKDGLKNAPPVIEQLIEIISYELDMIDHIRRIQWQNDKVAQFANEDSDLVNMRLEEAAYRQRKDTKKQRNQRRITLIIIALITLALVVLVWKLPKGSDIGIILATIYAPLVAFLIQCLPQSRNK